MIGVLGHDSALYRYTGPGTTWANGINIVMNHASGAGSISRPVDQQSSGLPLYHGHPPDYVLIIGRRRPLKGKGLNYLPFCKLSYILLPPS